MSHRAEKRRESFMLSKKVLQRLNKAQKCTRGRGFRITC